MRLFQELDSPLERDIDSTDGFAETRLLFAGYAKGSPLWAELMFSNTGTRFYAPVLTRVTQSPKEFILFAGSKTIYGDMQIAGKISPPFYLNEAVKMVSEYAQMCIENSTVIEDCGNLRGDVHVATITKEKLTWIREPKSLQK